MRGIRGILFTTTAKGKRRAYRVTWDFTKFPIPIAEAEQMILDGKAKLMTQSDIMEVYRG